jgi:hypothetical protein
MSDLFLSIVEQLGVCRFCGREFLITYSNKDDLYNLSNEDDNEEIAALIEKSTDKRGLHALSYYYYCALHRRIKSTVIACNFHR